MNQDKLHRILNGVPFSPHQPVLLSRMQQGKGLGWSAIDKLRRVRKHPTYPLRFLPSRTERRLGTQRRQHALICAANAHLCKPTPVQAHPSTLDFVAAGGLMATTVFDCPQVCAPASSPRAFFGVDVASAHLDICSYGSSTVKRIANTPAAISRWLGCVPPGSAIAMESTGRYHQALAAGACAAGFAVYLLNPRDVRSYARGLGARGKTDRLDAQVIARYGAHEHHQLRLWQPVTLQQQALDELLRRRAVLVNCQQKLRMSAADCPAVLATLAPLMQEFDRALKAFDRQIRAAVQAVDAEGQAFDCITSVPGIGLLSGAALLGVFRRLASASADAVIAFLGLDPRPMDSGHKVGLRRLSKRGPPEWRRLLFNAAMSGSATKAWKGCYEHERTKGLSGTAALNVLARKMVRVAFSLFKNRTRFELSVLQNHAQSA